MENKPKVLFLHSELSPYRLPLFEELSKKVDLFVYFCTTKSRKRLWNTSTEKYSFKRKILNSLKIGSLIINYSLPYNLLSEDYQVYVIDDDPRLTFSKLLVLLAAKLRKKPILIWTEVIEEGYYQKINDWINRYIFGFIRRLVYHHSDAFMPFGSKTIEYLLKSGVTRDKIYPGIPAVPEHEKNGIINLTKIDNLKQKLGFRDKKVILFVGYFTKRKGVIELIKVFKQLARNDVILIMAGAGKEEEKIKSMAAEQQNIYFPGYVDGKDKTNFYTVADIFVLPTYIDPWSLVTNEAMMFGLPIITTTGNGASELIDGNGFVIKPGDNDALKETIEYILENEKERSRMCRKSKEIIKDYTIERSVKKLTQAIYTLVNM